ncbi:hypothetical protein ACK8P5_26685 (plasmid) [Paenibacillus sp. EC2-1]|uniref:hypothetical protein n=1 Tax=Paenibacillus sp. EC2-1 TaxID=3388665 RepID=UPI003BEEB94D
MKWIKKHLFINFKMIETALIALLLWWSFILILPMDTFGTSSSYQAMAGIAPEEVWSAGFFIAATFSFVGMIYERKNIRLVGLITGSFLWLFVSAMMAIGNIATTGTGTYFVIFCLNTFVVYKVGEQYGR